MWACLLSFPESRLTGTGTYPGDRITGRCSFFFWGKGRDWAMRKTPVLSLHPLRSRFLCYMCSNNMRFGQHTKAGCCGEPNIWQSVQVAFGVWFTARLGEMSKPPASAGVLNPHLLPVTRQAWGAGDSFRSQGRTATQRSCFSQVV